MSASLPFPVAKAVLEGPSVSDPSPWSDAVATPLGAGVPFRARRKASPRASAPLLPEAPGIFPWLARRFAPGEVTVWWGRSAAVQPLLELLYAGSAAVDGEISLIEGENRFHPYRIGELGRRFGVAPEVVLRRIRIARAFTVHQLVALVDGWAEEARRRRPTLLVAHELPRLFETVDVRPEEREALLRHVARTLRALLDRIAVPLLLLLEDGGFERFPGLLEEGPRFADVVAVLRHPRGLALRAYRDDARVRLVRRPDGQRGIEEFSDPHDPAEVIAWAAPHRPTAKPWTSA